MVDELVAEGGVGEGELFEEPEDPLGLGVLRAGRVLVRGRGKVGLEGVEEWDGMADAYVEMVESQFGHGVGVGDVYSERMLLWKYVLS